VSRFVSYNLTDRVFHSQLTRVRLPTSILTAKQVKLAFRLAMVL